MVEINEAERKKEKRIKRNEDNLRDNVKRPNIWIIGVPEEEDKKKGHEKILEEIIAENSPKIGEGNSHPSPRNPESSKQDKPKAKYPKTHINQINKEQILKAAREKQQITHKEIPIRITADLSIETFRPEGNGRTYLE